MKIAQLMAKDVLVARPEDTIRTVAEQMSRVDIGALPVCDGRRLLGMITDRDIVVRAVAFGRGPDTTCGAIMSRDIKYCFEDDDVDEVCQRMGEEQIRRIPVLDRHRQLVGIVSLGDLATDGRPRSAGRALEKISQPTRSH